MRGILLLGCAFLWLIGCDNGFEPPAEPPTGSLKVNIAYTGTWPSADSLLELRFVGMRFIPQDTTDFLQLNNMVISPDTLPRFVDAHTLTLTDIEAGLLLYNGIAERFGTTLLDWRPAGLYEANDGIIDVRPNQETEIDIMVDFGNRPVFPPEG